MNASDLPDETLFEGALKCRTPVERAAYLDQACAGQPALRRNLEALLQAHDQSGEFLEPTVAAERPTIKLDLAPEETPGTMIGRYKLLQKIGEGGMGIVYMAEQTEPVIRKVALKIIKLGMDTRQVVARFEAERQALALMDHSNIAKVLDAGATDTGRPYFVMELVRGVPITEYCDKNKLSTKERLELFIPVCQAIQHAHQKGIIHRDIKPSNVMVTLHDGQPVPRVIDFGIAKATNQRLTEKTLFTNYAQMIGTPAYMSPEQAEMSGLDIDTRTDVYSLGVLLYELLTGTTPFDAKELLSKGYAEMQRIIAEQEPPKPSTRMSTLRDEERTVVATNRSMEASALNKMLRGDLDWIVMKALEKDRTRRYETANGFATDLRRHLADEPVTAGAPSAGYKFRKFARRNKGAFAAGAVVAVALVTGLGLSLWQSIEKTRAYQRALAAERVAKTEAKKSQQVADFLKDMLKGVGPSVARGRDTKLLREILDETAKRVGTGLPGQDEVESEIKCMLGRVYTDLGEYSKAVELFRQGLALERKVFGDGHPYVTTTMDNLALALIHAGQPGEAEKLQREALEIDRKRFGNEHSAIATARSGLALILAKQGKFAEAEAEHREALRVRRQLLGEENPDVATSLSHVAEALKEQGKLAEAEALHRQALAMTMKLLGPEHREVAKAQHNLAEVLRFQTRLAEAEPLMRASLATHQKLLGDEHPDVATCLNNLAGLLLDQGRREEAAAMYGEVLSRRRKFFGNEHPDVASSLNNLAVIRYEQGELNEAEEMYREALRVVRKVFGDEHPHAAGALNNLARLHLAQRNPTNAEPLFSEAVAIYRKMLGTNHPQTLHTLGGLAQAIAGQGRLPEAEALFRETLSLTRVMTNAPSSVLESRIFTLADVLRRQRKLEEARPLFDESLALARVVWTNRPAELELRLQGLAELLTSQSKPDEAEPLYLEALESLERRLPRENTQLIMEKARVARWFANCAWADRAAITASPRPSPEIPRRAQVAERMLRECLDLRLTGTNVHHWRTAEMQGDLGFAILAVVATETTLTIEMRSARLREAESLLLAAHEGLQASSSVSTIHKHNALERLTWLYHAWPKPEQAVEWELQLDTFDKSQAGTNPNTDKDRKP